jgi:hypothetical protein
LQHAKSNIETSKKLVERGKQKSKEEEEVQAVDLAGCRPPRAPPHTEEEAAGGAVAGVRDREEARLHPRWRSPPRRRACPWPAWRDSPLVQGTGGRAGAAPPSVARRRERVASPSGNGEPPPPAARRPRAGAALAGASRAVAIAAAPADGEVTDGGGWKRNEWWGVSV